MNSPLDHFAPHRLIGLDIPMFDLSFYLTNTLFYMILALVLYVGILLVEYLEVLPNRWSSFSETVIASITATIRGQLSRSSIWPLLFALFGGILGANLIANLPYGYAATSSVSLCFGLSLTVFLAVTLQEISYTQLDWLGRFIPEGAPVALLPMLAIIEILSYSARAVSLGVRLLANIVAGHTLLSIISTLTAQILNTKFFAFALIAISLLTALVALEFAVAAIQAYVFVVLTAIYVKEAEAQRPTHQSTPSLPSVGR